MRLTFVLIFLACSSVYSQQFYITDYIDLNSSADEHNPMLTNDGRAMFFTRAHHPENTGGKVDPGDIWFSQYTDSTGWKQPIKLGETINTPYYNGSFEFFQNQLYLYTNYRIDSKPVPGVSIAGLTNWPTDWSQPKAVEIKYYKNSSANTGNAISSDGKIMILSMESYKSQGAEDLYVSFWDETAKIWGEPKNLGAQINTKLQELTPFLGLDNKTLFFSSNGHGGFGSRDIYASQRLDESWTNWSEPRNLGQSVNTKGAEMGYRFYPDNELAIYTSTENSDGYGDIRIVEITTDELNEILIEDIIFPVDVADTESPLINLPVDEAENTMNISGKITDLLSKEPVFARAKILGEDGFILEHYNDTTFNFTVPNEKNYVLQVDADGYFSKQVELIIKADNSKEIIRNIEIEKLVVGARVELKNVLFVRGETEFIGSSYAELDLVAEMMSNNPTMKIELSGHTDGVGNAQLNLRLSQERVDAVINYLVEKGVDINRLSGKGYGGTVPIASNATESTRKLNRRVEFTILSQ